MNPIDPRAQATLDAAMNLIRTAASSAAMRVAENLTPRGAGGGQDLRARPARRHADGAAQEPRHVPERVLRVAAREGRQGRRAARRPEAQARVGRLADAQPRRREGGRGADELRPPRPDDLARVRMAAARPRRLHGRAARLQQRRRRPQPAARRDRRRRAAQGHRGDLGRARQPPHPGARHRPGGRPRHARVLRRDPAPAPGARRPSGAPDGAHRRGPGQPARRRQLGLRQPAARRPRLVARRRATARSSRRRARAATWTCSPRTGARWRRHSPADPRRWTASAIRCPRRAAPTSRARASTPPPTSS